MRLVGVEAEVDLLPGTLDLGHPLAALLVGAHTPIPVLQIGDKLAIIAFDKTTNLSKLPEEALCLTVIRCETYKYLRQTLQWCSNCAHLKEYHFCGNMKL